MIKTKFIQIPNSKSYMADAPVTQALWHKIMGNNPSYFNGDDNPVETVSWSNCQEFIKKLNERQSKYIYRLPSEKEWELCAKSCDQQNINDIAWYWENSDQTTHPVKQKLPNELGFYDMLGNCWEWCEDKWNDSGSSRVVRGGSWNNAPQNLRSGFRNYWWPEDRSSNVGFRLCRVRTCIPLHSNPLTLDSEALALAIAKVQTALDELKGLVK